MNACAILTYHSQNIAGHGTSDNDHVALRQDLERLRVSSIPIVPLAWMADWLEGRRPAEDVAGAVSLSFDDGCDFDVRDLDFPGIGIQRSFLGILDDFIERHGAGEQPKLHATSFVIASPEARRIIDERSLYGHGWISDDWWADAAQNPLLSIGNHGWDHNHPDLADDRGCAGGFLEINTAPRCEHQVIEAADYIKSLTGEQPEFFAYPFGESSDYLRGQWFPEQTERHRCRVAVGTEPGHVHSGSDRWNLPRYVCGRDWRSPGELISLLRT